MSSEEDTNENPIITNRSSFHDSYAFPEEPLVMHVHLHDLCDDWHTENLILGDDLDKVVNNAGP